MECDFISQEKQTKVISKTKKCNVTLVLLFENDNATELCISITRISTEMFFSVFTTELYSITSQISFKNEIVFLYLTVQKKKIAYFSKNQSNIWRENFEIRRICC